MYILLPDKKEHTYTLIFQVLKALIPNLNPLNIIMDFEKGAMNAIHEMIQKMYKNGNIPEDFAKSKIALIIKKGIPT